MYKRQGGQSTLFLVALQKGGADLLMEPERVADQNGHAGKGDQPQRQADAEQKDQGEHDGDDHAQQGDQLVGQEGLDHLHVGGAPLDDVAGLMGAVPLAAQMLNVAEQLVPHGLDKGLAAFDGKHLIEIPQSGGQKGADHHRQGGQPEHV